MKDKTLKNRGQEGVANLKVKVRIKHNVVKEATASYQNIRSKCASQGENAIISLPFTAEPREKKYLRVGTTWIMSSR